MMSAIVTARWIFSRILFLRRIGLFEDVEDGGDAVRYQEHSDDGVVSFLIGFEGFQHPFHHFLRVFHERD